MGRVSVGRCRRCGRRLYDPARLFPDPNPLRLGLGRECEGRELLEAVRAHPGITVGDLRSEFGEFRARGARG